MRRSRSTPTMWRRGAPGFVLLFTVGACVLDWPLPLPGSTGGAGGELPTGCALCPEVAAFVVSDPPPVRTVEVGTSAELVAALADATAGDDIVLQAGVTYAGAFFVGFAPGTGPVTIRTSAVASLPDPCQRIDDEHAAALALIVGTENAQPAFRVADGAHDIRLIGVELSLDAAVTGQSPVVEVGGDNQPDPAKLPTGVMLRHVSIRGGGSHDGVHLSGRGITLMGSRFSGIGNPAGSSLPSSVVAVHGAGPFAVINNRVESEGPFVVIESRFAAQVVPQGVTIAYNSGARAADWLAKTTAMHHEFVRIQSADQANVTGNRFEGSQPGGNGAAVTLAPGDPGDSPVIDHIGINANFFGDGTSGIALQGLPLVDGVLVRDNLITLREGDFLSVSTKITTFEARHNTFARTVASQAHDISISEELPATNGGQLVIDDNVIAGAKYGIRCTGGAAEMCLDGRFDGWEVLRNAIIRPDTHEYPAAGNDFLGDDSLFVDPPNNNYRIVDGHLVKGKSDDPPGSDPGADFDLLDHAAACRGE